MDCTRYTSVLLYCMTQLVLVSIVIPLTMLRSFRTRLSDSNADSTTVQQQQAKKKINNKKLALHVFTIQITNLLLILQDYDNTAYDNQLYQIFGCCQLLLCVC